MQLGNGERLLGLKSSVVIFNSFFNITNESTDFEISKLEKQERRYSLDGLEVDDENFLPEYIQDELLRPVVIDEMNKIELEDVNLQKKKLHTTEEEIKSIAISNKTKKLICSEFLMEFQESIFQDFESFLRAMRIKEDDVNFFYINFRFYFGDL